MNKVVWKDNLLEIKKSWPRFLSILLIMLLGVAFFVGIRATSPAMIETARQHFEQYSLPDGQIKSTLGLNDDDIALIQDQGLEVEALQTIETVIQPLSDRVKIYPNTNKGYFYIADGSLPTSINEIALDVQYKGGELKIGDSIELEQIANAPNSDDEVPAGTQGPYLKQTEFVITGFVDSSLYYSRISRGAGNINGYVLIHPEAIAGDLYSEALYWSDKARQYRAYSQEYEAVMASIQKDLELAFADQPSIRLTQLKNILISEVDKGQKEVDDGYQELADAEDELEAAKKELEDGRKKYEDGLKEYQKGLEEYEKGLAKLQDGQTEYHNGLNEINVQKQNLNSSEADFQVGLNEYQSGIAQFNSETAQAQALLEENALQLSSAKQELDASRNKIDQGLKALQSGQSTIVEEQRRLVEQLRAAIPNLAEKLEQLKEKAKQDQLAVDVAEKVLSELTTEPELTLIYLKEELNTLQTQKKQLEEQISNAPAQLDALNQGIEQLQAGIAQATEKQPQLEQALPQLEQQIRELVTLIETQQLLVNDKTQKVNQAIAERDRLISQINELDEADNQYPQLQSQLATANEQVAIAQEELNEANNAFTSSSLALDDVTAQQKQMNQQLANIHQTIESLTQQLNEATTQQQALNQLLAPETLTQLIEGEQQLLSEIQTLEQGIQQLTSAQQQMLASQKALTEGQAAYEAGVSEYEQGLAALEAGRVELVSTQQRVQQELNQAWQELQSARQLLDNGWSQLTQGEQTLAEALAEIEAGQAELRDAEQTLTEAKEELDKALKELEDGEKDYQEGLETFEQEKKEALLDLKQAEADLIEAQQEIDDLKEPTYYLNLRDSFDSYDSLYDNANQIKEISTVFPIFFFAIALLVTFTTIKRMVSEQRNYMGTMKQMGYPNHVIMSKFVLYALLATLIGTIIGIEVGYRIFPPVIMNAYNNLFHFDHPVVLRSNSLNWLVCLLALGCALIPAIWSPLSILRTKPANLLQPEPPKAGQRILLERIGFIWNRLSFNRKMTVRNLLRYKGRNLMTLIGVAGCTMLIVTGFGISDTIDDLVQTQFTQIQQYDAMIYLQSDLEKNDVNELKQEMVNHEAVESVLNLYVENWQTDADVAVQSVSIMVPLEDYQPFINIHERALASEIIDLDNESGAVITERLAEYVGVSVGENLELVNNDGQTITIPVSKIAENYIGHYVYLSPSNFEQIFDVTINNNAMFVKYHSDYSGASFETELAKRDEVLSVLNLESVEENVQETMSSLGVITLVLIVSAAALAFVVLYNLTNINVSERIRELSTIKVLGFYNREVSMYIYDEILILTTIGSVIGLGLGYLLNQYILKTIQMPNLLFYPIVNWQSMVISAVMTFIFASVVMLVMHQKLKKIDMVEALKAVE